MSDGDQREKRPFIGAIAASVIAVVVLCACREKGGQPVGAPSGPGSTGASWFSEITDQVGLDFVHQTGRDGSYFYPEIMGAGGALLDYDNDGDLDIYLINGGFHSGKRSSDEGVQNRLFRHDADGIFRDVTDESGLGDRGYGMGCAVGDIDNDGDLDVYVSNYGPDALYRNNGDGTFANISSGAVKSNDAWGCSACFFDYDADGYLDLFVTNYLDYNPAIECRDSAGRPDYCGPQGMNGVADVLYHNNGDGTFTDVSASAGIAGVASKGLGVVCLDLSGDGRQDVYVANDMDFNQLWVNQGDGTFIDEGLELGLAVNDRGLAEASMGVTMGDADGDGFVDLFMTHLRAQSNTFYHNSGHGYFEDATVSVGLALPSLEFTGFGTVLFDFDHDADLDVLLVNGRVVRGPPLAGVALDRYWNDYAEPNQLFANDGAGRFEEIGSRAGGLCVGIEVSRGLALGDIDSDGDLDVLVTNAQGPARLYRNDAPKKGHWLMVRAVDPELNRDAIGALVEVVAGGRTQRRTITRTYSYLSSSDPRAHFGLGKATAIDGFHVRWLSGERESFAPPAVDQLVTVTRGGGMQYP